MCHVAVNNSLKIFISEAIGTALLLAGIVGSGIMGDTLSNGNAGIALLANSLATGALLVVLILLFESISGAHFNPLVSAMEVFMGQKSRKQFWVYLSGQTLGAFAGVAAANIMFAKPLFFASQHIRAGWPQWFSECIATFGLFGVLMGCSRRKPQAIPYGVGAYILSAYWFTSSTSFANPIVTLARTVTDTFTGIRPQDAPCFIVSQIIGATLAILIFNWLIPKKPTVP